MPAEDGFQGKSERKSLARPTTVAPFASARAMISELDPSRSKYKARLADYNSDPSVTFADLQKFLRQLEDRLAARVAAR
jgi:hypothetical protein